MTFSEAAKILDIRIDVNCDDPRYDLKKVYITIPSMNKKMYLSYSVKQLVGREEFYIQMSIIKEFELNKWLNDNIEYDYNYKLNIKNHEQN